MVPVPLIRAIINKRGSSAIFPSLVLLLDGSEISVRVHAVREDQVPGRRVPKVGSRCGGEGSEKTGRFRTEYASGFLGSRVIENIQRVDVQGFVFAFDDVS